MKFNFVYWETAEQEKRTVSNIFVLFLALMLLLLAFFILLTSISTISRDKYTQVIKSIESTFHIQESTVLDNFMNMSIFGDEIGPDKNLKLLGDLFKAELPLVKTTYINDGKTLKVTLDTLVFFNRSEMLNPSYYGFLDRLIDLLNDKNYFLYCFISRVSGDFSNEFKDSDFQRIDYLNRYLSHSVKDLSKFDLGIDYKSPAQITFYLSKREG